MRRNSNRHSGFPGDGSFTRLGVRADRYLQRDQRRQCHKPFHKRPITSRHFTPRTYYTALVANPLIWKLVRLRGSRALRQPRN
jgi:hypothetical protein